MSWKGWLFAVGLVNLNDVVTLNLFQGPFTGLHWSVMGQLDGAVMLSDGPRNVGPDGC